MRVHHLNCGTLCPISARLVQGEGGWLEPARMVCHCLLIESDAGLILVDSGLGLQDVADPARRLGRGFSLFARARFDTAETAIRQVEALGFSPTDVTHVVPTHLDLDHVGGLSDFPHAKVHVFHQEHRAAMHPPTILERQRYRAAQWSHQPAWVTYEVQGERWFGFDTVRQLEGLPPEILLIPLPGHTRGHCAVAVEEDERWLLHCGDAYFHHTEMDPAGRSCPKGLDWFQRLVAVDGYLRRKNQERLRQLAVQQENEVRLFCAHDPVELDLFPVPQPPPLPLDTETNPLPSLAEAPIPAAPEDQD